jgi:hypothetical protein
MADLAEQSPAGAVTETDLVTAVRQVLERSEEPLTLSKIRAALPSTYRSVTLEALEETLGRQAAANVLHQYPKYRSPQQRYWDRPMTVHLAQLLRAALKEKPLTLSELRRRLPDYARRQADAVLEEQVARGNLYRHPALTSRTGPRFGAHRPDPRDYLRTELSAAFARLEQLGFTLPQLREGALELLHEEEWASRLDQPPTTGPEGTAATPEPASQRPDEQAPRAETEAGVGGQSLQAAGVEAGRPNPVHGDSNLF